MSTFYSIVDLLKNTPLIAAVLSFLAAQGIKVILTGKLSTFKRYGGMPSGHAAAASGLAFSVGRCTGYSSPITAVAAMLLMVIVADAVNLRPHVRDDLGHTWTEAFAGIALGFIVAHLLPARIPLW
ncbi:divergent PAP2 family protein [Pseudothermotoga thermarum]|uniref:Acid phosphatase/vanadium-dependent haloperoxidase related protein n=1 Tax=Pseudothermotoga thermarum DSM 5069 TaxID=688269 RepID=F7YWD7_9THEM|nr:divergent PAP2 family protein [Pseudothermotoga thermarum]AEH51915.1 acid phosphatase/vanadium-dependent haloperoxidase related protein [Pseudothermotoga thermarum DSM 5069]